MIQKETYEQPIVEIIEFDLQESIAASTNGAGFWEEIWGG